MKRPTHPPLNGGLIVYEGPSLLDRSARVFVALVGIGRHSSNPKTGPMVQSYIMRADMAPHKATQSGADRAICGGCRRRPSLDGGCYVALHRGPRAVWASYQRGAYERTTPRIAALRMTARQLRIGAYGDPAAVPVALWRQLTKHTNGHTGYTHEWKRRPALRSLVMASVDTDPERIEAQARSWRTFRVLSVDRSDGPETKHATERACPASAEQGHRTFCAMCRLCNGNKGTIADATRADTRRSIAIIDHSRRGVVALQMFNERNPSP